MTLKKYLELNKDEVKGIQFLATETGANSSTPVKDMLYILDLSEFNTKNMNSIKLKLGLQQVERDLS